MSEEINIKEVLLSCYSKTDDESQACIMLIDCLQQACKSTESYISNVTKELLGVLESGTVAAEGYKASLWKTPDAEWVKNNIVAIQEYYLGNLYAIFGDTSKAFIVRASKKGFRIANINDSVANNEFIKQQRDMLLSVMGKRIQWIEEKTLWQACVRNTICLLYPELFDLSSQESAEKGPFAQFKEKLQQYKDFFKSLQATFNTCVCERCADWVTKKPLGVFYIHDCNLYVKTVNIENNTLVFKDVDLQANLFPRLSDNLIGLCCVLDKYAVETYGKELQYNTVKVLNELSIQGLFPKLGYTYLPALQCCLRNGISITVKDVFLQEKNIWSINIQVSNTKLSIANLQTCLFDLFLYRLYIENKTMQLQKKALDTELLLITDETFNSKTMLEKQTKTLAVAKNFIRKYSTSLFYGYSFMGGSDAQIEYLAVFGGDVTENKVTPKNLTQSLQETVETEAGPETQAKLWFGKDMSIMEVLPDAAKLLTLYGNFITDVMVYYQKADFGYEANHRLYNNGINKKTPICLGKLIDGGDFDTYDCMHNNQVGGLAIIAGSRSGKGVCTNNLIGSLFARGYSIAYFDCKPEQALALWGFEKKFNQKFANVLKRPLRLVCLDMVEPMMSTFDATIECRRPPRMVAVHNIPTFYNTEEFKTFCAENSFTTIATKDRLFNTIRFLKGIHLVACLVNLKAHQTAIYQEVSDYCKQKTGKPLTQEYTHVFIDELGKQHTQTNALWIEIYAIVKKLKALAEKTKTKLDTKYDTPEKQKNKQDQYEADSTYLNTLLMYLGYFNNVLRRYAPYGCNGFGLSKTGQAYIHSDIIDMFINMTTDAIKANVRFTAITQTACNKDGDYLPFGLYKQFTKWNLITGANYASENAKLSPFLLSESSDMKKDSENYEKISKQVQLTAGNLSVKFPNLPKGEDGIMGYFTYRKTPASAITVFKTYLTLVENDYEVAKEAGAGPYGLSLGDEGVANLLINTKNSTLRDYILKNNIYSDYENKVLNSEIGFGGATEWLIQKATNGDAEKLQELVDGINTLYNEMLSLLNYTQEKYGKPVYATLEEYFTDMSYDSMYSVDENGVMSVPTYIEGISSKKGDDTSNTTELYTDFYTNDNYAYVSEEEAVESTEHTNASTESVNQESNISNVNDNKTSATSAMYTDEIQIGLQGEEATLAVDTQDNLYNNVDINEYDSIVQPVSQSMSQPAPKSTQSMPAETQQALENFAQNSKAFNSVPQNANTQVLNDATAEMFTFNMEKPTMGTVYTREQLTKVLAKFINNATGNDKTVVYNFKLDDVGHIYINGMLIAPKITKDVLQTIPPVLRNSIANGVWGDFFDFRRLYQYKNLRTLDLSGDRVTTAGKEMGLDDKWHLLVTPRNKRKYFPMLEHLIINGEEITTDTPRSLGSRLSEIALDCKENAGFGGLATKIWQKSPIKTCCKALGYGVGLKVFWGVASLLGPVGLIAAGLGTAAVALKEYDNYKAERGQTSNGANNTSFDASMSTPKGIRRKTKKKNKDNDVNTSD